MKKFETPEIEIALFSVQDILATSYGDVPSDNDELPPLECW